MGSWDGEDGCEWEKICVEQGLAGIECERNVGGKLLQRIIDPSLNRLAFLALWKIPSYNAVDFFSCLFLFSNSLMLESPALLLHA